MFHVITGGSGSGKSAYAEDCIVQLHKKHLEQKVVSVTSKKLSSLYYIATMMPYGAEMEAKIDRHRKMRTGKGFETVECFRNLHLAVEEYGGFDQTNACDNGKSAMFQQSDVLLECMSNLVANEWFDFVQNFEHSFHQNELEIDENDSSCFLKESIEMVTDKIWQGVRLLQACCEHLVIVTNEVFSDGAQDTIEMNCYKQILAGINRRMAAAADQVTEVVYGIPVKVKG